MDKDTKKKKQFYLFSLRPALTWYRYSIRFLKKKYFRDTLACSLHQTLDLLVNLYPLLQSRFLLPFWGVLNVLSCSIWTNELQSQQNSNELWTNGVTSSGIQNNRVHGLIMAQDKTLTLKQPRPLSLQSLCVMFPFTWERYRSDTVVSVKKNEIGR